MADARFDAETQGLRRMWDNHPREFLRTYLVQGVQDPRTNTASVLTRHYLLDELMPGRFAGLMAAELQFAVTMGWLLGMAKGHGPPGRFDDLCAALMDHAPAAAGMAIPRCVSQAFASLPARADGAAVPDYLGELLAWLPHQADREPMVDHVLGTFGRLWREVLAGESAERVSVLEPACGSANDYRFLDAFGIGDKIDYSGFDLCLGNVDNAKAMFPSVRFRTGNVLDMEAGDRAFDYTFVNDLFEHLSVKAMERAVAEVCRVTRRGLLVGFFRMHDGPTHEILRVGGYHINSLSISATRALFLRHAAAVEVVGMEALLKSRFGYADTPNKAAHVFVVRI